MNEFLPVAIIGAGPVGLAAAAHLRERGLSPLIFEKGDEPGEHLRRWGHVRVFSPWKYNMDQAARRLLRTAGVELPDEEELPTGAELRERYLLPLAGLPGIREGLHTGSEVIAAGKRDVDRLKDAGRDDAPFEIRVRDRNGRLSVFLARALIDASGTWSQPNPLGAGGYRSPGEAELQSHIHYGIPDIRGRDRERYAGKRVMVVGNGHSAFQSLLELAALQKDRPDTIPYWSVRRGLAGLSFGGGAGDALPARGALGERLREWLASGRMRLLENNRIQSLAANDGSVMVFAYNTALAQITKVQVNEIIAATGGRPDFSFLRELRHQVDPALESVPALAPLIDPNVHSCGTVRPHGEAELRQPEKNFYIVGSKSYGRAPTFLMATGYEQVRSVVAALAGDMAGARRVELDLPETGVCNSSAAGDGAACCAPPAQAASAHAAQVVAGGCC